MKKKFLASLLAITLSVSMSVTTFAAELPKTTVENVVVENQEVEQETIEQKAEDQQNQTEKTDASQDAGKEELKKEELNDTKEENAVMESSKTAENEEKADTSMVEAAPEENTDAVPETDAWTADDFTYEKMSDRLYGCDYSREFTVSGLAVSGFSESGKEKLETNKALVIPKKSPDGTEIMGVTDGAFQGMGLTSVKFPEGCIVPYDDTVTNVVTERGNFIIGDGAFSKNNITELTLPEGVIAVMTSAFNGNKLEKVTLPSTIWWMENSSFANNNISVLNFPKTCTFQCEIHAFAFARNKIKSVRLPDYTMVVEKKAFLYNPGVESVPSTAPSGEAEMGGVVYMYTDNPNLMNMERIHHIEQKNEAQLSWHQKLIVAGKPEVDNTWKAADFTFEGTAVTGLSASGIAKSQNDKELVLPSVTADGQAVIAVKGSFQAKGTPFTYVEIPETVTEIGDSAFAGCKLSKVTLPAKLKKIGKNAFQGNEIQKLSIPGTVEVIPASAFAQEKAILTELTLGEGVEEIQAEAFANSALQRVNLPDSLKTLDADAFKRTAADKIILYTNVEQAFPPSEYHKVKLNLGDWNESDFTYDGTVVTGFSEIGKKKSEDNHNLVIPDKTPAGEWVTEIGATTAQDTDGLFGGEGIYFDTVKLPSKVEKIGLGAFRGLKLQKVTFPETLTTIEMLAFQTNELREIILPDSVTSLGQAAFATNTFVEKLVLSKNLKEIPRTAFGNTEGYAPYTELIIPEGVTKIDNNAFNGNSLKRIEIPKTVAKIGSAAFMNTDQNRTLKEVVLHGGLTSIGSNAFGYAALTSIQLPTTVTTLNKNTFLGNANGKVIVYVNDMVQYEKLSAKASDWHVIKINPGPWTIEDFTYEGTVVTGFSEKGLLKREDKKELTIPDKTPTEEWVTEIASTEMSDQDGLFGGEGVVFETLTLPSHLIIIGDVAFGANGIQNVVFPKTLQKIGKAAFKGNELKEVILPDSVIELGQSAFVNNETIEKIVLSKSLKIIPKYAFQSQVDPAKYSELLIPEGVTKIDSSAFSGHSLKHVEIPSSVKEIGSNAFVNPEGRNTLESIVLHEGLEKIGSNAFRYSKIRTVDLPSTVKKAKELNAKAFADALHGNPIVWVNSQEQLDTLSNGLKNPTFELRNKNEFTYEVKGDEASITGLGEGVTVGEVLVLPRTSPDGKLITEIADAEKLTGGTFTQNPEDKDATNYKEVLLPSGIKRIGKYAFQMNKVEKINFPEGLEKIGEGAFNFCNLTDIILPDSVVEIGENVFSSNENLAKVVLSKNLTEIPERAFQHSDAKQGLIHFTELEIPDGIVSIGKYAFANNHLQKLVIPDSVKVIDANAFAQTSGGKKLESLKISKNLTEIGSSAFKNSALTYVPIPETLTTLKSTAFQNGKNGTVLLYANNEKQLEKNGSTYVPEGKGHKVIFDDMLNHGWTFEDFTYEGTTVTGWSKQGTVTRKNNLNLVIPSVNPMTGEAITAIGDAAFQIPADEWDQGHTGVESVNGMVTVKIPATVTKIGNNAFQYNNLETVELPEKLESIGDNAFNSNKMKKVNLPDSVTEMRAGAFSANDITEIKLSKGLTKLESGVFSSNIHLTHVDIPNTITEIGDYAFSGDRIASLVIPKSVVKIGKAAFKLHRMTEITVPGNVKEIGDSAFEGTYKGITMKKVVLEEGIEKIGSLAFRMGYLEEVEIPYSVTSMASDVFESNTGYNNSKTVRCYTSNPEHMKFEVKKCQEFVFRAEWTQDCFEYAGTTLLGFSEKGLSYVEYMKDVILPDKNPNGEWIKAINAAAFKGFGLTSVKFPVKIERIGEEAFLENALTEVELPYTAKDIASNAFDENVKVIVQKEEKPLPPSGEQEKPGDGNQSGNGGQSGAIGKPGANDKKPDNKGNGPKTGDTAPILPFGIIAVCSLATILCVINKKRNMNQ